MRVVGMAKFTLDDGRTFRCHGRYRGMAAAEIGDEVEVIYDPGNPKRARVAPVDFGGGYTVAVMAAVAAVAWGVAFMNVVVWIHRARGPGGSVEEAGQVGVAGGFRGRRW
ncbi:DUF3592 domain-containing protein [Streptomyces sp. NPDC059096]|uniref:DUF3592 domain-containing protein n=1 Tax=Streptomyces sp. NPDC059096 TaxID=3346727 RepID=UPI00369BEA50